MKLTRKLVSAALAAALMVSTLPLASAAGSDGSGTEEVDKVGNGNFFKVTTVSDFEEGTLENLKIDSTIGDGALKLAAGSTEGSFTSPVYRVPSFTAMTPSWDADTPNGSSIELQGRVYIDQTGEWSSWISWGRFGQSIQRGSENSELGKDGGIVELTPDELLFKSGYENDTASKIQYRMVLRTSDPSIVPDVRLIASAMKNTLTGQAIPVLSEYSTENLPDKVDLVGYPYAQGRRDQVRFLPSSAGYVAIADEICSMTTITGMINLKGEDMLPEEVAVNFRDTGYGFGNWPYTVAGGASFGYEAYVRYGTWDLIKSELAHGNAVGVSIKYTNNPDNHDVPYVEGTLGTVYGHIVMIRGYYTRADGREMVLVNDSGVGADRDAVLEYPADQFITGYMKDGTWVRPAWTNNVCYVLHGKEANAGNGSIQRVPAALSPVAGSTNEYGVNEFELRVNGEKLSLPANFNGYDYKLGDPKVGDIGQGGVITITADKGDGSSLDGSTYKTIASKPAVYGYVTADGTFLADVDSLIPDDYDGSLKITAYVIFNNGITYEAAYYSGVDKSELQAAYDANKNQGSAGYTESSWAAFSTALSAVEAVLGNDNVSPEQVEKALNDLQAAVNGLTAVDKSALQDLYNVNKDKKESGYTAESWAAFTQALSAAEAVLKDGGAAEAQVEKALSDLQKAIDGLAAAPIPVDKTALQELYQANKGRVNDGYTAESWAAFTQALSAADAVLQDEDATAEQVKDTAGVLERAVNALKKASVNAEPDVPSPGEGSASSGSSSSETESPQTGENGAAMGFFALTSLCALAGVCFFLIQRRRAVE